MAWKLVTLAARASAIIAMAAAAVWITVAAQGNVVFCSDETWRLPPYHAKYGFAFEGGGVTVSRFEPLVVAAPGPPLEGRAAPGVQAFITWYYAMHRRDRLWSRPGVMYQRAAVTRPESGDSSRPYWLEGYRTEWRVHYWVILAATAPLPLFCALRYLRRVSKAAHNPARGRCAACGYDLRPTPGRCPACGAEAV